MIPTYNPTEHLREALQGVLEAQRELGEPMQIEVVDDASPTVDVPALVASWHLPGVSVFRRASNGGLAACWNHCIERATGAWIHLLHQDDLVSPLFYRRMSDAAARYPEAGMLFCRNIVLAGDKSHLSPEEQAETGPINNWLERICASQRVQCPATVLNRSTYQQVGGFDSALRWVIDWEMWVRVAASFQVVYVCEPLATYRVHAGAETNRLKNSGAIAEDLAVGLAKIRMTLRSVNRTDCIPSATSYVWNVSGYAAHEANLRGRPDIALLELRTSLRRFGARVGLRRFVERLRLYAQLRWKLASSPPLT